MYDLELIAMGDLVAEINNRCDAFVLVTLVHDNNKMSNEVVLMGGSPIETVALAGRALYVANQLADKKGT